MLYLWLWYRNNNGRGGAPPPLSFIEQHLSVCQGTSYSHGGPNSNSDPSINNNKSSTYNNVNTNASYHPYMPIPQTGMNMNMGVGGGYSSHYFNQAAAAVAPAAAGFSVEPRHPMQNSQSQSSPGTSHAAGEQSSSSGTVSTTTTTGGVHNTMNISSVGPRMYSAPGPSSRVMMYPPTHQYPTVRYVPPYYGNIGYDNATSNNKNGSNSNNPDYLNNVNNSNANVPSFPRIVTHPDGLAQDDDRLLLTDYFFYLMQQLQVCHFSEVDRKTRGGKRDNIAFGYAGLECMHCAGRNDTRKFFWSDVDRLANSFAEIPSHILRCKKASQEVKANLACLKSRHSEQMARLPRGSQKVFFRRMWRRIHGDKTSSKASTNNTGNSNVAEISPGSINTDNSSDQTQDCTAHPDSLSDHDNGSTKSNRVLLAIAEDPDWLSDMDCFVRKQIEVFCATPEDLGRTRRENRRHPIRVGHVGLRCMHCASSPEGAFGSAITFPDSIGKVYEAVRDFQKLHMHECPHIPEHVRFHMDSLTTSTSLTSVLRRYFILAAKALGMIESVHGIDASPESALINQSVLSTSVMTRYDQHSEATNQNHNLKRNVNDAQLLEHQNEEQHRDLYHPKSRIRSNHY